MKLGSKLYNFFFNVSYQVVAVYRLTNYLYNKKVPVLLPLVRWFGQIVFSCDIAFSSKIGKNLKLPHPFGIVIGAGSIVGDDVTIFQQVTLGGKGTTEKIEYPTIENGVRIYAGAKIIGNVTIGQNAIIGANSVVLSDVPARAVAVGIPAKILVNEK